MVGYRVITGGRAFALPLLERCSWMDVRTVPVSIHVEKAYAKGGTPIDVEAIASVKIDSDFGVVGNAIERFLQHDPKELVEVSRQTLEGHLRSMVATLSPEQVNEDRLRFAHAVAAVVQPEMGKLGLRLDTFKILRVSDQVEDYDSLGRARLAEVLRDAAIAEAEGFGDADQREAEAQQRAEMARVEAELPMQVERVAMVANQLQADVVAPAEAECARDVAIAKGDAASILEEGAARAEGLSALVTSWQQAGPDARAVYLTQRLQTLLPLMRGAVPTLQVKELRLIGEGANRAPSLPTLLAQVQAATGFDAGRWLGKRSVAAQPPGADGNKGPEQ
ncbi:MAG: hypothetical protein RLZZ117_1966 [Cyanobacteriota bacterium]|jgi:flotillin